MPVLLLFAFLILLAPCATSEESDPPAAASGNEIPRTEPVEEPIVAAEPEPEPEPEPPDTPLERELLRVHSRITPAVATHLRGLAESSELQNNIFAKMGGSSIESRAYLHCLGSDRNLDLGGREEFAETLAYFREGRIGRRGNPFRRESLAAQKGWSLRQGLTGRPSRAIQEIRASRARYALTLFGGNDVQARNPQRFGERLEQLLESLVERGVIPILGATSPRGDDEAMDDWAKRYNRVSRGIARAWKLPYIDFYLAMEELPGRGLAGDGVHSNVLLVEGRGRACVFTEEGLARGMNMRNLRTLESLHRLRQVVDGAEPPDEDPPAHYGEGTAVVPLRVARAPFAEHVSANELTSTLANYSCEEATDASGPERVVRLRIEETTSLWLGSLARRGTARVYVLDGDVADPSRCIATGDALEVTLEPGVHHIVFELTSNREDATLTSMIDFAEL
ncbi:MAG: SGNH/GDSL hydrolase family protein [Myxococcota bacterium]